VSGGERLGQIVPGAGPERLDAAGHAGIAGHHHHDRVLERAQGRLENLQAGNLGHVEVHEDDVELAPLDRLERLFAAADEGDVVAIHLEDAGATLPQCALIVHHEHPDARLDFAGNGEGITGRVGRLAAGALRLRERVGHPALLVRLTDIGRTPRGEPTVSIPGTGRGRARV
jgi:hypothetical protein